MRHSHLLLPLALVGLVFVLEAKAAEPERRHSYIEFSEGGIYGRGEQKNKATSPTGWDCLGAICDKLGSTSAPQKSYPAHFVYLNTEYMAAEYRHKI